MLRGEVGKLARKRGWFDSHRAPLSNVLMTGGKLHIPPVDYRDVFLPAYARDILNGEEHFIIERATERSRWFADFDCPSSTHLTEAQWEMVARQIHGALTQLTGQNSCVIVLRAKGDNNSGKTGIHFIAPDILATMQSMLEWRKGIMDGLTKSLPDVNWDEVFDEAVYKGGSLRMALSSKIVPCTAETHDARCCGGSLRTNAGRRYEPYMLLGRDGVRRKQSEKVLATNAQLLVSKTSIRHGISAHGSSAHDAPRKSAKPTASDALKHSGRLDDVIEGLPPQHRNLMIVDRHGSRLRVDGEGARYCTIVGREHRSSTVYYVVDEAQQKAIQYCWCRKGDCVSRGGVVKPLRSRGVLPSGFVWG